MFRRKRAQGTKDGQRQKKRGLKRGPKNKSQKQNDKMEAKKVFQSIRDKAKTQSLLYLLGFTLILSPRYS